VREAASLAGKTIVLNLSGRGDKDVQQIAALDG
jgi:tryptophan synthase beta subunit